MSDLFAAKLPTRKSERWRYTPLNVFERENYRACYSGDAPDLGSINQALPADLSALKIVFANGVLLSALDAPEYHSDQLQVEWVDDDAADSLVDAGRHFFAAMNIRENRKCLRVRVKKHCVVDKPLLLAHFASAGSAAFNALLRVRVELEEGASLTLVEHFVSSPQEQNGFINNVTELVAGKHAELNHYRIHDEQEDLVNIGSVHADLHEASRLSSFSALFGTKLTRLDIDVRHRGEGAHCELRGMYLPKHRQHVELHTCIDHCVPRCSSDEVFRGIVADSARAVFNGRIHILRDAQKTSAQLSNRNLLTSNKAEVDTKPELEIYADDVRCSHGATVAMVDEQSIYYLRSRGISEKFAKTMLSFAFIEELLNGLTLTALANYLRERLHKRFDEKVF